MKSLGRNIKKMRELRNLTQKYVADHLGMSQGNYARIEGDEIQLSLDRLKNIAEILGCSIQEIEQFDPEVFFVSGFEKMSSSDKGSNKEGVHRLSISEDLKKLYEDRIQSLERYIANLEDMIEYLKKEK